MSEKRVPVRVPPCDIEIEGAVLGSLLSMPSFIGEISEILKPIDFFRLGHKEIYKKMLNRFAEGKPIDLLSLELSQEEREDVNAIMFDRSLGAVSGFGDYTPTLPLIIIYAEKIRDLARRRRLMSGAGEIAGVAYDDNISADEAESQCLQVLLDILEQREVGTYHPLRDIVDEYGERIINVLENPQSLIGLDTGLRDLNRVLGGLEPEILIVIAGRPGMGKTSLALTLAMNAARQGHNVGFASLEMSKRHLLERMLARQAGVDSIGIRSGVLSEEQKARAYEGLEKLKQLPIYFDCQAGITVVDLAMRAKKLAATKSIDLLIVDYLGLLRSRPENIIEELGWATELLRKTGQNLHIPVIVLHQLSRAVEKRSVKIPILSDLRDCFAADTIIYDAFTGEQKRIEDAQQGDWVFGLGKGFTLIPRRIKRVWQAGIKSVYKITTKTGRQIAVTLDHRFFVNRARGQRGWWPLSAIKDGDKIAVVRKYPPTGNSTLNENQALILGWLIGDGWIGRYCAELSVAKKDAGFAKSIADEGWGLNCRISDDKGKFAKVTMTNYQVLVRQGTPRVRNPFMYWCREQGIAGKKAQEKFVPQAVFMQPPKIIAPFLRGLFHADGSVTQERWGSIRIRLSTTSERLARDVQHLLLRLGIASSVRCESMQSAGFRTKQSTIWIVTIGTRRQTNRFATKVGFLSSKNVKLQKIAKDPPPGTAHSIVKTGDYYFEAINDIEYMGDALTYDLSIEGSPYLCASDILVHNSGHIEQNADQVWFLYREDYYNQEQEKRYKTQSGPCILLIAKNRMGRTGKITLWFEASGPYFRDMEKADEW